MKIEDIINMWGADSKISKDDLARESLVIPELHNKYYKIFLAERVALRKLEEEHKILYKTKVEYYSGRLSQEELAEKGWEPFQLRLIKGDMPIYLDADIDLINSNMANAVQREKVEYLESIIKTLNSRGFLIKNAIDFLKFTNGG